MGRWRCIGLCWARLWQQQPQSCHQCGYAPVQKARALCQHSSWGSAQQAGFRGLCAKAKDSERGPLRRSWCHAYGVAFSFLQPSNSSCSATPCVRTVCMHRYWHDKGVVCIVTGRVLNLAALGFTIAFSGETSHWHATFSAGNAASSRGPGGGIQDWLAQGRLGQDERASWRCCCCCTSGAGSGA